MQLFQNKIENCVAVSGTAFSDRHVKQMKRFTNKVLLAYDGDFAGVSATLKTGYSLIKGDIDCEVIEIPNKFDPDEWVSKSGPEVFISEGVQKSTSLIDYHLKSSNFSEMSPSDKSTVVNQILTEVRGINNPIISNEIIKKLAEKSNVEEYEIKNMIPKKRDFKLNNQPVVDKENETFDTINDKAVLGIIRVLLHGKSEAKEWMSNNLEVDKITNTRLKKLIERMLPLMNSSSSDIIAVYEDGVDRKIISQIMIEEDSSIDFMQMSIDCLSTLRKDYARQKINQFRQKIRQLEADGEDTTDLMSEVLQMQKDMNA